MARSLPRRGGSERTCFPSCGDPPATGLRQARLTCSRHQMHLLKFPLSLAAETAFGSPLFSPSLPQELLFDPLRRVFLLVADDELQLQRSIAARNAALCPALDGFGGVARLGVEANSGSGGSPMHHVDHLLEEKKVSGDGPDTGADDHAVERLFSELLSNHVCSRVPGISQAEFCFVPQIVAVGRSSATAI